MLRGAVLIYKLARSPDCLGARVPGVLPVSRRVHGRGAKSVMVFNADSRRSCSLMARPGSRAGGRMGR